MFLGLLMLTAAWGVTLGMYISSFGTGTSLMNLQTVGLSATSGHCSSTALELVASIP